MRGQSLYLYTFGPGPRWVGIAEGLSDKQEVWVAWPDEEGCEATPADGNAIKVKKSIHSITR